MVVVRASRATLAEVTLRREGNHLVHAAPWGGDPGHERLRLYRLRLQDAGEQLVKVNPNGRAASPRGTVECSELRLTAAGRPRVRSDFLPCYTGGIDAHGARGWTVRLNRLGHRPGPGGRSRRRPPGRSGAGERDRCPPPRDGHRHRFGAGLWRAGAAQHGLGRATRRTFLLSGIDLRFARTNAVIQNSLATRITQRDGARPRASATAEAAPASWFRDPLRVDLHLTPRASGALGRGRPRLDGGLDIDGGPRDAGRPDLGADEAGP
jgi:hypothetical protein